MSPACASATPPSSGARARSRWARARCARASPPSSRTRTSSSNRVVGGGVRAQRRGRGVGPDPGQEWGLLETPILLTNTMAVGKVSDAAVKWMTRQFPGIGGEYDVIIPLVGECDDSWLNDAVGPPRPLRARLPRHRAGHAAARSPRARSGRGPGSSPATSRPASAPARAGSPSTRDPAAYTVGRAGAVELRRACARCASTACPWARCSSRGSRGADRRDAQRRLDHRRRRHRRAAAVAAARAPVQARGARHRARRVVRGARLGRDYRGLLDREQGAARSARRA